MPLTLPPVGPKVQGHFNTLLAKANKTLPRPLQVTVYQAPAADFPNVRDFAYCHEGPGGTGFAIGTAPKLEAQSDDRIKAILAHELGHAVYMVNGCDLHNERDTDRMAEALFGVEVAYDNEDVQTLKPGRRPRPSHLPQ